MVEKPWSSARESFEIETPSAFEIEDSRTRSSNAPNQARRNPLVRFIILLVVGVVIGVIAVCVCFFLNSDATVTMTPLDNIDKPVLDWTIKYGSLKLPKNGMRILLGEAMETPDAHVCVCLGIGWFSEPKELHGVMSVLSDAIMHGSTKYPGERNFSNYLGDTLPAGGPEDTQTCFSFHIRNTSLDGALDRLVEALREPSFHNDVLIERVKALTRYYNDDTSNSRNRLTMWLVDMNPKHPAHYPFKLGEDLQANEVTSKVQPFFKQYFNAQDMTLSVIAPRKLEDLVPVVSRFDRLHGTPDRGPMPRGPLYGWQKEPVPPFLPGNFAGLVYRKTEGSLQTMEFSWLLSDFQRSKWRTKPWLYALRCLRRSLKKKLSGEGWINDLQTNPTDRRRLDPTDEGTFSVLDLIIQLTPEGIDHMVDVGKTVFEYLSYLRTVPRDVILNWLTRAQSMEEVKFRYEDAEDVEEEDYLRGGGEDYSGEEEEGFLPEDTIDTMHKALNDRAEVLAKHLLSYPEQYVLSATRLLFETDVDAQLGLLSELTVDSVRLMVTAKKFDAECTTQESLFGVGYAPRKPLTQEMLDSWKAAENLKEFPEWMQLPAWNPFLPVDTTKVSSPEAEKVMNMQLFHKDMIRVFTLTSTRDDVPEVICNIRIFSEVFEAEDADTQMKISLWQHKLREKLLVLEQTLKEIYKWSWIEVGVDVLAGCITLHMTVLGNLLPLVIRNVSQAMMSLQDLGLDDETIKDAFEKNYLANHLSLENSVDEYVERHICRPTATFEQQREAMQKFTTETWKDATPWLLRKSAIEMLVVGNVLPTHAAQWSQSLVEELPPLGDAEVLKRAVMPPCQLPTGATLWKIPLRKNSEISENAVMMYMQFHGKVADKDSDQDAIDDEMEAIMRLFLYMVKDNTTVTKRIFSYEATIPRRRIIPGGHTLFVGGWTQYEPDIITRVLHNWWARLAHWVSNLRDDEAAFNKMRDDFLKQVKEPEELVDVVDPFMSDFMTRRFTFDYMGRTKKIISGFTAAKFSDALDDYVGTLRQMYVQLTRTDGEADRPMDHPDIKRLSTDDNYGVLKFTQTWDGEGPPSDFVYASTTRPHSDLSASVPAPINIPEISYFDDALYAVDDSKDDYDYDVEFNKLTDFYF